MCFLLQFIQDSLFASKKAFIESIKVNLSANHIPQILSVHEDIEVDRLVSNCGLTTNCSDGHYSFHLYTGFESEQYPSLCIDSKMYDICKPSVWIEINYFFLRIMGLGVNNCGRGINVIIIDRLTKSIVKAVNFDTFAEGIYTHICCTLCCHSYIILLYFIIYF